MTKTKEQTLSDKRVRDYEEVCEDDFYCYPESDVREAVKKLKKELIIAMVTINHKKSKGMRVVEIIDKIFGDKLVENKNG